MAPCLSRCHAWLAKKFPPSPPLKRPGRATAWAVFFWAMNGRCQIQEIRKSAVVSGPALLNQGAGVGAALQGWTIVVGAGIGRGWRSFLLVGLFGASAQSRLAGAVVDGFTREHHVAQAALDGIEFG